MRYRNGGKINVALYLVLGGLLVIGTTLFFYFKDANFNVGFFIIGIILLICGALIFLFSNKKEKKPYYQEKAKKIKENKKSSE